VTSGAPAVGPAVCPFDGELGAGPAGRRVQVRQLGWGLTMNRLKVVVAFEDWLYLRLDWNLSLVARAVATVARPGL
jgi:hypothetical protein